jgi:hypothetical protein
LLRRPQVSTNAEPVAFFLVEDPAPPPAPALVVATTMQPMMTIKLPRLHLKMMMMMMMMIRMMMMAWTRPLMRKNRRSQSE